MFTDLFIYFYSSPPTLSLSLTLLGWIPNSFPFLVWAIVCHPWFTVAVSINKFQISWRSERVEESPNKRSARCLETEAWKLIKRFHIQHTRSHSHQKGKLPSHVIILDLTTDLLLRPVMIYTTLPHYNHICKLLPTEC